MYFDKVLELLNDNGIILIESHHPNYEKEDFERMIDNLVKKFKLNIINHNKLLTGSYYDNNRYFYYLKNKFNEFNL